MQISDASQAVATLRVVAHEALQLWAYMRQERLGVV